MVVQLLRAVFVAVDFAADVVPDLKTEKGRNFFQFGKTFLLAAAFAACNLPHLMKIEKGEKLVQLLEA